MKARAFVLSGIVAVLVSIAPLPAAHASDDYVTTVVNGVQEASVYVAPGIPGTNSDTAPELAGNLTQSDHIVLVMLPAKAATSIGDPVTFVHTVSDKLGNDDIIGVTIGDQAVAYSAVLPQGEAADLMARAKSVSTTDAETLVTFSRNVHQYEAQHPHAVVSSHQSSSHTGVWALGGGIFTLIVVVAILVWVSRRRAGSSERITLRATPDGPRRYVEQIIALRQRVADPDVRNTLSLCCQDLEKYFSKYASSGDDIIFEGHLKKVVDVLRQYIDVQNNARYYDRPSQALVSGKQAMTDFSEYVLSSCRRGSGSALTRYNVDTKILQAQRYR